MSKHQGRMQVIALHTSLAAVQHERDQLAVALAELGYCHEQQAAFIVDSATGPNGSIARDVLFNENKTALAEAVATNKRLTDDLEFQAHRYTLLQEEVRSRSVALVDAGHALQAKERVIEWTAIGGSLAVLALAVVSSAWVWSVL